MLLCFKIGALLVILGGQGTDCTTSTGIDQGIVKSCVQRSEKAFSRLMVDDYRLSFVSRDGPWRGRGPCNGLDRQGMNQDNDPVVNPRLCRGTPKGLTV